MIIMFVDYHDKVHEIFKDVEKIEVESSDSFSFFKRDGADYRMGGFHLRVFKAEDEVEIEEMQLITEITAEEIQLIDKKSHEEIIQDVKEENEDLKEVIGILGKSKIIQEELSIEEKKSLAKMFPSYRVAKDYKTGDVFNLGGALFQVLQPHVSQEDWKPNDVPALYKNHTPENVIANWIQPTGAHDAYSQGAVVNFNGDLHESILNENVWKPNEYGWNKL